MILYHTVGREGISEATIGKSRFICRVARVEAKAEAESFFAEFKAANREANHHVPAFVIGDKMQLQWASDDGEPQGTAGAPILSALTGAGVTNAAVMVVRYFGGIKLGTGGLVRAYSSAAKAALEDAGIVTVRSGEALFFKITYPAFDRVKAVLERQGIPIRNVSYTDDVGFEIHIPSEDAASVTAIIADLTGGATKPVTSVPRNIYTD